jgi:hypothetical protein
MQKHSEENKRWRAKNPEKVKAHTAVNTATRKGKLARQACEVCGSEESHAHHDDYSKPLEVRWLCPLHHKEAHHGPEEQRVRKRWTRKAVGWVYCSQFQPAPKRDAMLALAKAMREEGQTYLMIAVALGVSKGTVYKWLNPNPRYK